MKEMYREPKDTLIKEVLKAFLPYSKNNLLLSYSPNRFFNELERKTNASRKTLSSTISRAKREGLLVADNQRLKLSWRGRIKAGYIPSIPNKKGLTLVVFDIPESRKKDRYQFRCYLRMMKFEIIQKSVWGSEYVLDEELPVVIGELKLDNFVRFFDAEPIVFK